MKRIAMALVLGGFLCMAEAALSQSRLAHDSIVGTWYLELDTTVFDLPEGLPLVGIATFHSGGTLMIVDAGDFGQATFLQRQHSPQLGAWDRARGSRKTRGVAYQSRGYLATTLFMEADLDGEVTNWSRVDLDLDLSRDAETLTGAVFVTALACYPMLPTPTALTCPDPIANADLFEPVPPPVDIPVTLRRLHIGR